MPYMPCSVCNEPKYVGKSSRPDMVCRECRKLGHAPPNRNRSRPVITCYVCGEAMTKNPKLPQGQAAHYKCVRKYACRVCGVDINKGAGVSGSMVCFEHRNYRRFTCADCDSIYMGTKSKRRKRELCPACRASAQEKPAPRSDLLWHQCRDCDQWICNPRRSQCQAHYRRTTPYIPGQRLCSCGAELPRWARFCGDCRTRCLAENERKQRREYRRKHGQDGNHRRRARRFGAYYEPVSRMKVCQRDNWACGICHRKIDHRLKYPDPMSASLDHIVPLSLGGEHSYKNTQAAHWQCNVDKGASAVGEQLALIG